MAYIWGEKYLKEIIRVMDVSDLKFKYDDGTLVLTSSQSVIDACHDRCIPVAAIEEKGKSDLDCDYIIMDVDQVEDDDFEEIYRRCAGLPLDIGITRRTYLREFSMNDLDDLFAFAAFVEEGTLLLLVVNHIFFLPPGVLHVAILAISPVLWLVFPSSAFPSSHRFITSTSCTTTTSSSSSAAAAFLHRR